MSVPVPVPVMRTGRTISQSMTVRPFGGERPAETTLTGGGNSFFCHPRETRARRPHALTESIRPRRER
jgi:hypothetical protein